MTIVSGRPETTHGLLEREEALAALYGAHAEARAGSGRLVLVAGEAGVGKTSLLRTFLAGISRPDRVLMGACDPLFTPRPLGPFADIASDAGSGLQHVLARGASPSAVFDEVRVELAPGSTVLVIEDLHWADEATLDVVRLLARRIESIPALVVLSYRDDELERTHPLRVVLGELSAVDAIERVRVEALSPAAVAKLAESYELDAHELYRLTSGNPFYVREVLESGDTALPESIRSAVLARTARLSDRAVAVAEAVSVAPPRLDLWTLERVCGDVAADVDECLSSGVLVSVGSGVSFRHELARLAVEGSLGPTRRIELHRRALAALADPPHGALDLARLAHHAEAAGDSGAVRRYAPAAAEQAFSAGAFREAAAQYARALRFADSGAPADRAPLLERRSLACYLADDQVEAIEVISEAIAQWRDAGADLDQARALAERNSYLLCRGLYTQAEEAVVEASRLVADDPDSGEAAAVTLAQAYVARIKGDLEGAIVLAQRAAESADRAGAEHKAAEARVTIATAELYRDTRLGRELMDDAIAECRELGLVEQVARALNNLGTFGVLRYDQELANRYLTEAYEYCVAHTLDLWRINVLAYIARSRLDQGRWTEAADAALLLLQDPRESPWPHSEALVVLGLVRGRRGDPGAHESLRAGHDVGVSPEEFYAVVDLAAAEAELAWLAGKPEDVDRATASVLATALERRDFGDATRLAYWRRLAGLESRISEPFAGPYASGAAGAWRDAADEWAERRCPYETALALSESGDEEALMRGLEICRELGASPLATRIARRLRQLGTNGVPRGPRPSTRSNPAQLTARQLDVLALLAEGLRNAEIADRLVVSRRTVDHHVSAILRKLDATTRGEAVAAASRLGVLEDR